MIVKWIVSAVIAYLLGSISTGILLSEKLGHDLRSEGSKNTGASNALRVLGLKGGAITFAGDALKAVLAVLIGKWLAGEAGGMIAGLFVVLGHNWPCFFQFRGGKGIACSQAVLLMLFPMEGGIAIALCLIVIAVTKYISVGSMTMLATFTILISLTRGIFPYGVWALVICALGFYRHRANIQRLRQGTENKLSFGKKK